MGLTHLGGIGKSWSTFLDINKVSDNDYLGDLGSMSQESNSLINLRRVAGATYKTKHWDYLLKRETTRSLSMDWKSNTQCCQKLISMATIVSTTVWWLT